MPANVDHSHRHNADVDHIAPFPCRKVKWTCDVFCYRPVADCGFDDEEIHVQFYLAQTQPMLSPYPSHVNPNHLCTGLEDSQCLDMVAEDGHHEAVT